MDKSAVKRYYELKVKQKELERELAELRRRILDWCGEMGLTEAEVGLYRVRVTTQDRRKYDEDKLLKALPDAEMWRLVARPDPAKIAGLVKLNILSEEALQGTYTLKQVPILTVEKI